MIRAVGWGLATAVAVHVAAEAVALWRFSRHVERTLAPLRARTA